MGRGLILGALVVAGAWGQASPAPAQGTEDYKIYTDRPRIFLRPQRLRLLRRERERQSMRWQQFEALMAGKAPMPEPGFAGALFHQVSGDQEAGRQAVAWALGQATDLRQLALVFDWCQDLLSEARAKALAAKLQRAMEVPPRGINDIRSRTLAAAALAERAPEASTRVMTATVRDWWRGNIVPALKAGRPAIRREDAWALYEILHVVRDNLNLDLRDDAPEFFKNFPIDHLMSHYPATFPGPDAEYRIPAAPHLREPDLRVAALSRAAELSMVAFDSNAPQSQVLQGWLINDHFLMRGPLGIPYEFLWANPYQPGLSYYHVPLIFHDEALGRLFIRSSWEESADWLGVFDGEAQLFHDGKVTILNPQISAGPLSLTEAVVLFSSVAAGSAAKFKVRLEEEQAVFVVGLQPHGEYNVEIDDREMHAAHADAGGILSLELPRHRETGVRLCEWSQPHRQ